MMIIDPAQSSPRDIYRLMITTILPPTYRARLIDQL